MKVGLVYDVRNPKRWLRPFPQFYAETLEHMQAMDELGFASINLTEHHFNEDGYCPSTTIWNTAAAVKTKRAMLGQSVLLMPFFHPVRLAEDTATIDILSNGRAWIQAGQAHIPSEFAAFGIEMKYRGSLTEEGMDIIRKCFTEEEFSYTGRRYKLKNVRMTPKPVQKPHPPMFMSAQRLGSKPMDRTIEMGFHAVTSIGPITPPDHGAWEQWHTGWVEAVRRHGKDPAQFQTSCMLTIFVTDDPERAWRNHREGLLHRANSYRLHNATGQAPIAAPEELANWKDYFHTPESAVRYIRREYGKNPPTHLLLWGVTPGMTYAESYGYHQLFIEKVKPQLGGLT